LSFVGIRLFNARYRQPGVNMSKQIAIVASAAIAVAVGGAYLATTILAPADRFADCSTTAVGGDIGGPFTLVDQTGRTVTDKDVITGPTLIYFGYTFCPDVCPLDNARNAEAVSILAERGIDVKQVFITIDPARDTPEVLAQYTANFSDDMIGLTGTDDQIAAVASAYRTFYQRQGDDPEYYLMDHMTFSYLMFPDLGFVEYFSREETPEAVADRLACFVAAV
jgi:protein SCO1/2